MTRTSKDALKCARNARRGKMAHFTMKITIPPCQAPAKVGNGAKEN